MTYRVAINGFGRIGRDYVRALLARDVFGSMVDLVAVNDLWDPATLAYLLAHDSTFGPLGREVRHEPPVLIVDGRPVTVTQVRDPLRLDWADLGVDLVIEATGRFRSRDDAAAHLKAGAKRVLITAPGKGVDATLVPGVNADTFDPIRHEVISAASCTTNCAAPMAAVLHAAFGIEQGHLATIHAYTNDQVVLDTPHKDPRRGRTAAVNIIPSSTGAAKAIGLVLPALAGRLDGIALRVPVENGSIVELTCVLSRESTVEEVNRAFAAAEGQLHGILRYSTDPLVSRDVIGDPASCVFDAALTCVQGRLATMFGWYDNEWGYTNRLVDLTLQMAAGS